jgi:PAS domain S-box-containing protein
MQQHIEASSASPESAPFPFDALRTTIECAPLGIAHFDPRGRVLMVNEQLCTILRLPRERLIGANFFDFTHPDDIAECTELTARVAGGELPSYRHEKRFARPDGSIVWTCVSVSAARNTSGDLLFLIGMAEDISERREAQARHKEAEQRLAAALAASLTATFRWDIARDHVECEPALLELWDMDTTPRHLPASEFTRHVHADDIARVDSAIASAVHAGGSFREEFRVTLRDGGVRWIRDVGRVFDSGGGSLYMVGACTDVTEARNAQEEIRASEARLRALANTLPQLVWIGDSLGRRSWFNDRWREYTGVDTSALRDHGWHGLHHPEHAKRVIEGQLHCFATGEIWEDSFPLRAADGSYRWFLGRAVPVRDAFGTIQEWFGSNTDVTQQIQSLEAAQAAKKLRDEMVAIVAHDLRNPVHTIALAGATLASDGLADAQRSRLLTIIRQTASNMGRLLDDLLDMSRMDSGSFALSRSRLQARLLLAAALEQFEGRASERGIALDVELDCHLEIVGDHDRLAQVLSNLIGNALKFTPSGGRVEVRCTTSEEGVVFSVRDTGPGIAAVDLPHLFERFWKADAASAGSAGLGLAIARGIVDAHGGRIWVESEPGAGTTFRFIVPAA